MKKRSLFTLGAIAIAAFLSRPALRAGVIWSGAGSDTSWSTSENWHDNTSPGNPNSGTIWFGDDGCEVVNSLDEDWVTRDLIYTNISGFYQCFDELSFPQSGTNHVTHSNRGWIVGNSRIMTASDGTKIGAYIRMTNEVGFLQLPPSPRGLGSFSFRYHNETGKSAPAATVAIQTSSDGSAWNTVATLDQIQVDAWQLFETNFNDSVNSYVRLLNPSASAMVELAHIDLAFLDEVVQTTDLNEKRLTIKNGYLRVGDTGSRNGEINHTKARLYNGTLQVGSAGEPADLAVGHMTAGLRMYGERRGNQLTLAGILDAANLRNLYVGYGQYSSSTYARQSVEGLLDLSQATISSGERSDTLVADKLYVGSSEGNAFGRGKLKLPSTLKVIEVEEFKVGCRGTENTTGWSTGELDFGLNSQLESLQVGRWLNLGSASVCTMDNWPATVDLAVGRPEQRGRVWIGAGYLRWIGQSYGFGASLTISNATFSGSFEHLYLGVPMNYSEGHAVTGRLDLTHGVVVTDGVTNSLSCERILVGGTTVTVDDGLQPANGGGTLLLPPSLTNLVCDVLQIGAFNNSKSLVDFGENSQLERLAVREKFSFARRGGAAWLKGLPAGVNFEIGTAEEPAALITVGSQVVSAKGLNTAKGNGDLVATGVVFNAWADELEIGKAYYKSTGAFTLCGRMILSNATLQAFNITHDATIGRGMPQASYKRVRGELHLPPGTMNIGGNLYLGYQQRSSDDSLGLLDLEGTTVTVGDTCDLWDTGVVSARLQGVSGGLDLLSSSAAALSLSNNATINLTFELPPVNPKADYWGVRWAGEHSTALQELVDAGNISWSAPGLTPKAAARIGVAYNPIQDYTFVGLAATPFGTTLLLR